MNNYGRRWRGWGPQSSEIEPIPDCDAAARHCHICGFKLAKPYPISLSAKAPIREPILIITRRAFTAALSLTGLAALAGLSPFRLIADALADERRRRRQAAVAARHGAWAQGRARDHHRIRLDDLPALRGVQRERVPEDQGRLYRHQQDPLRVPRIPARHQGGGGLDAVALHRQGRRRQILRGHRPLVQAAKPTG